MANDDKKDDEAAADGSEEDQPKKSKKPLFLGGGIVGLIGVAYVMATMAIPGSDKAIPYAGPFSVGVHTEESITVNLYSESGSRFLVMGLKAKVYAYDEAYPIARVADPLYEAILMDALISLSRKKTPQFLTENEDIFTRELLETVNPILFPIHVGDDLNPYATHGESGMKAGESMPRSTYRTGFKEGKLDVNGPNKTLQLDGGTIVEFGGFETDLLVTDTEGQTVFVDVSLYEPEFVGEISIGPFGRISKVLKYKFITQ